MTKRTLSIPALALTILLLSGVLAPAAFATGTHSAARTAPSAPTAAAIGVVPLGQTIINLVIALGGVGLAIVSGVTAGLNSAIGAASTDPAAVAQSNAAAAANETATNATVAAALTNSVATGHGVGSLLSGLAHDLGGIS